MSPGSTSIEEPTFLATLQTLLAVLEDDVSQAIPENTYLTLVSQLQILYNIHSGTSNSNISASNINNINNINSISNVTNFNNVLPVLITMYDSMSYSQRQRAYENNNYTNLMNTARSFWSAMSLAEQREYRTNMGQPEIEFGGPVHRIIYPRS